MHRSSSLSRIDDEVTTRIRKEAVATVVGRRMRDCNCSDEESEEEEEAMAAATLCAVLTNVVEKRCGVCLAFLLPQWQRSVEKQAAFHI